MHRLVHNMIDLFKNKGKLNKNDNIISLMEDRNDLLLVWMNHFQNRSEYDGRMLENRQPV